MKITDTTGSLSQLEWDFSSVPDRELKACLYWEYARESKFIRTVRGKCTDPKLKTMTNTEAWRFVGDDIERIQSLGYAAEVFLQGFFFDGHRPSCERHPDAPPITGSFPSPWQAMSDEERRYRGHIRTDVEVLRLKPFTSEGGVSTAEMLLERALIGRDAYRADIDKVHRDAPGQGESTLRRLGKYPSYHPKTSILWEGGQECTIVEIYWGAFTNDQIVASFRAWLKENRPSAYKSPDNRGHKPRDIRADLKRLGIMRLLHCFTFAQLWPRREKDAAVYGVRAAFPEAQWTDSIKWYDARREARKRFRDILPFLPVGEMPLSWPTKGSVRMQSRRSTTG